MKLIVLGLDKLGNAFRTQAWIRCKMRLVLAEIGSTKMLGPELGPRLDHFETSMQVLVASNQLFGVVRKLSYTPTCGTSIDVKAFAVVRKIRKLGFFHLPVQTASTPVAQSTQAYGLFPTKTFLGNSELVWCKACCRVVNSA
jgi:hypothetical protein